MDLMANPAAQVQAVGKAALWRGLRRVGAATLGRWMMVDAEGSKIHAGICGVYPS